MSADVISYHAPRGKHRADPGRGMRAAAILTAALAIAAATWMDLHRTQPAPPAPTLAAPVAPAASVQAAPIVLPAIYKDPTPTPARTASARRGPRPIPLDARGERYGEDLEILSAAELDAISQARH